MLYLAAYQVSSIVFTGQGKVGSENGMPEVDFQIAQRADFFEQLTGLQTTFKRPLVNSRDEPHCGPRRTFSDAGSPAEEMARLHVIFFDNTLCHVASLLKVGVTQMILSMIEQERMNPSLLLDDPLNAVVLWSHDPSLQARARMASGQELTAVELQFLFLEEASRFMSSGKCGDVPNAADILSMWEDTLLKLRAGDFTALARRLDWVLKLSLLRRTLAKRPDLAWSSPQIKHLDHLYSSLDPAEGLFWAYDRNGFHERVVNEERIEWFVNNPPEDTRAWTRAMILRRAQRGTVDAVDWDSIRIRTRTSGGWSRYTEVELSDPLGFTKTASAQAFGETKQLEEILEGLAGGYASDSSTSSTN
jgi:proteasome accessory factor A